VFVIVTIFACLFQMKSTIALNFIGFAFYLVVTKNCKYYLQYLSVLTFNILLLTVHAGTNIIY